MKRGREGEGRSFPSALSPTLHLRKETGSENDIMRGNLFDSLGSFDCDVIACGPSDLLFLKLTLGGKLSLQFHLLLFS